MKPAALLALLAAAALAWWLAGHPGYETQEQRVARMEREAAVVQAAKPKLYRWRDRNGVLQLTDKPPKGRKYEAVDMDSQANVNVIPMSEAINPPDPNAKPAAKAP
jgi:uncharacterized protein YpmB